MFPLDDTIAAIASAPGGAVRGIIRLSGPDCVQIVARLGRFAQPLDEITAPRRLEGHVELPERLGSAPATLYLWPTRRSYTREPSAELHLPGSPPLLSAALAAACAAGARLAQPGEFTLRAFLAGRLDLTQAEAVLGVIDATDKQQLETALSQLAGGLAQPLARLRERLLDCLAHLEAGLDFVEEDIAFITPAQLSQELAEIENELQGILAQMTSRVDASDLARVVLYGLPNAGKSSLLNALAGGDVALVSPEAGTTRDYVARRVTWRGRELLLCDTAGITSQIATDGRSDSALDAAMQQSALAELSRATLRILCLDASRPPTDWETAALAESALGRIVVKTKCDLPAHPDWPCCKNAITTSSTTGAGLGSLQAAVLAAFQTEHQPTTVIGHTAERCQDSLRLAAAAIDRAQIAARQSLGEELVAGELRLALVELGRVAGAIYTDDILDRVFSRFCIGK